MDMNLSTTLATLLYIEMCIYKDMVLYVYGEKIGDRSSYVMQLGVTLNQ